MQENCKNQQKKPVKCLCDMCVYVCVCMCVYVYIYICVCMYVCMCVFAQPTLPTDSPIFSNRLTSTTFSTSTNSLYTLPHVHSHHTYCVQSSHLLCIVTPLTVHSHLTYFAQSPQLLRRQLFFLEISNLQFNT